MLTLFLSYIVRLIIVLWNFCFSCMCAYGESNVFLTLGFGQRKIHETLAYSAREKGFDLLSNPSLPLRRLKALADSVCFMVHKTIPTYTSPVTALRWFLFDFPFLRRLWLLTRSPFLLLVWCAHVACASSRHASPPPNAFDFSFALISLGSFAPLIFHHTRWGAGPSPYWT